MPSLESQGSPIVTEADDPIGNLGFELGEQGINTTPRGWEFIPDNPGVGGVFSNEVPPFTEYASDQSFGSPSFQHPVLDEGMGTWRLQKTFYVPNVTSGHQLSIEVQCRVKGNVPESLSLPDGENFVGENDAFVEVRCYNDGQQIQLPLDQQYSDTALTQFRERLDGFGSFNNDWTDIEHSIELPSNTEYVEIDFATADGSNSILPKGSEGGGNAGVLFDDVVIEYPMGLIQRNGLSGGAVQYAETAGHAETADHAEMAKESSTGRFVIPPQDNNGEGGELLLEGGGGSADVHLDSYNGRARVFGELDTIEIKSDVELSGDGARLTTPDGISIGNGSVSMNNNRVIGLADPIASQHAVNLRHLSGNYYTKAQTYSTGQADGRFASDNHTHSSFNGLGIDGAMTVTDGGDGWRLSSPSDSNRAYIAPIKDTDAKYGSEISFENGSYNIEAPLDVQGIPVVRSHGNYQIQKNGTDGQNVINFKT